MHINPYNLKSTEHIHIKEYPTDAVTGEGDRLQHPFLNSTVSPPTRENQGTQRCKKIGMAQSKEERMKTARKTTQASLPG